MPTYSLWLEPPPSSRVRDRLGAAIRAASSLGAGGPPFPPHITLAGSVDLPSDEAAAAAAKAVAAAIRPPGVPIRFHAGQLGRSYHTAVFLVALRTPALKAAAAAARAAARERWSAGVAKGPPAEAAAAAAYEPHLSLLYSNDDQTKIAAFMEVNVDGGRVKGLLKEAGVSIEEGGINVDGTGPGAAADPDPAWTRVTAWRTEGDVAGWRCVADCGVGE